MPTCRICNSNLEIIWDLGNIKPSGFVTKGTEVKDFPLRLAYCNQCQLYQLAENPPQDSMYRQYWYKSSLNKSMLNDLKDIVKCTENRIELKDFDTVVDIGCNDGSLFDFYSNRRLVKIGFDPALNLAEEARKHCDLFFNDYFDSSLLNGTKAKVITSIAMFYDVPNPVEFIKNIYNALDEDGIWVVQFTDLYSMISANAFDNICHEHLFYYDIISLSHILNLNNLYIFDAEYNKVNGGSLRLYITKNFNRDITREVDKIFSLNKNLSIKKFIAKIDTIKNTVINFLEDCKNKNLSVGLLGASTKANTLLQYFGIDNSLIPYAYEVNSDKFGLITVGSNIEILPEDQLLENFPEYLFVGPWHFIDNILSKPIIKRYMAEGGSVVVPLPEFKIYSYKAGEKSTGEIIDSLITTVVKCFFAQEDIMNQNLTPEQRLNASIRAQKLNARRNMLIRELDSRIGNSVTPSEKTYE